MCVCVREREVFLKKNFFVYNFLKTGVPVAGQLGFLTDQKRVRFP